MFRRLMFLDSSDVFDVFVNMKKQAYLQPQPSGGPPVLGLALFFLSSSSAFLDELTDHESRSKTTSSANHLARVCNTPLIRFRLLSYFIHNWHWDCFFFLILFILGWMHNWVIWAMLVLWQNEYFCLPISVGGNAYAHMQ